MENVRKASSDVTTTEIVFLFIGGAHQVFHLAADEAVAAALHRVRGAGIVAAAICAHRKRL